MASSRVRLWKCQKQVLEDLRADDIIIYLRQDDIINEAEWEILQHEVTTRGRAEKLLDLLFQKMRGECGGYVYTSFRHVHVAYIAVLVITITISYHLITQFTVFLPVVDQSVKLRGHQAHVLELLNFYVDSMLPYNYYHRTFKSPHLLARKGSLT